MSFTKYAEHIKKLPSWLYKIGAQTYYDKKFPRHLFIETTAKCNLSCDYCPRENISEHMDFGLFKAIVDEASTYGQRSFSLHLFGEPLLYPRIIDAIRYIKQCNRRHTVLLTTNGTRLNQYVDELIRSDCGVDEIIWTWRTEAKFKEATIRKLKGWGHFRVRLIKEITPEEEVRRWESWPKVEFRSLHNYGGQIDLSKWSVPNATTRWACYHPFYAPAVAWNGNILLCCADPNQKEVIGNVKTMTVSQAWKKMENVRQTHINGKYEGICKNCDVWKSYPNMFFRWQYAKNP